MRRRTLLSPLFAFTVACQSKVDPAEHGPLLGGCDLACATSALVRVVGPPPASGTCVGAVVHHAPTLVLTAGHCVKAGALGHVTRLRDAAPAPRYGVVAAHVHPGFDRIRRPTVYDFALLEVRGFPRVKALPVSTVLPPEARGASPLSAPWIDGDSIRFRGVAADVNVLSLRMLPAADGPCPGSSGTPIVLERGGSFSLAAVVSRGSRTCDGPVSAGLVPPVRESFVQAVIEKRNPGVSTPSCGACGEELEAEGGACATAVFRCDNDASCRGYLRRVDECIASGKGKSCSDLAMGARELAVRGCLCTPRCMPACGAVCG